MNDANGAHDAKLRFSPEEIRLATDEAWILTKNSVMEKIVHLMAELSGEYRVIWAEAHIGGEEDPGSPKISRGENYRGLPWVMLDYPRVFGREDVMAIRTMFWWGHAFIVTLHLKGKYQRLFSPVLQANCDRLAAAGFHRGISEDEWRHEHAEENYRPLTGDEDLETGLPFLKLSASIGIGQWERAYETMSEWFTILTAILASCPAGERGLSPGSSRAGSDL
jgi:hypothetical protein